MRAMKKNKTNVNGAIITITFPILLNAGKLGPLKRPSYAGVSTMNTWTNKKAPWENQTKFLMIILTDLNLLGLPQPDDVPLQHQVLAPVVGENNHQGLGWSVLQSHQQALEQSIKISQQKSWTNTYLKIQTCLVWSSPERDVLCCPCLRCSFQT